MPHYLSGNPLRYSPNLPCLMVGTLYRTAPLRHCKQSIHALRSQLETGSRGIFFILERLINIHILMFCRTMIYFELNFISREINWAEHEYMNTPPHNYEYKLKNISGDQQNILGPIILGSDAFSSPAGMRAFVYVFIVPSLLYLLQIRYTTLFIRHYFNEGFEIQVEKFYSIFVLPDQQKIKIL